MIIESSSIQSRRLLQPIPFMNMLKFRIQPLLRTRAKPKSYAKLARKRSVPSITLPPTRLPPPRRKRVNTNMKVVKPTFPTGTTAKVEVSLVCAVPVDARIKEPPPTATNVPTRVGTPEALTRANIPDAPTRPSAPEPELPLPTQVLRVTIDDLYKAARRTIASKNATPADKAILEKLRRATWRHNLIAGVKSIQKQIQNFDCEENARIMAERHKRLEEHEKWKWEVVQNKQRWAKLIEMAKEGHKVKMNPPKEYLERWKLYDEFWAAFDTGRVSGVVPFEMIPWPTQDVDSMEVEDYELFILSPARPGYEVLSWYERVLDERRRWDVENVKKKVVPYVGDDIKERVVKCAEELLKYLDVLVDKYTRCDH
ncbi:hypothetical protein V5O48_006559 [Marasmius crinis-equi]|uniref:Uncharacterized protein n=1 Tax=Marasmius crinis-equi TaxID=585013 RepID=A0ABR3FJ73_9AGAR